MSLVLELARRHIPGFHRNLNLELQPKPERIKRTKEVELLWKKEKISELLGELAREHTSKGKSATVKWEQEKRYPYRRIATFIWDIESSVKENSFALVEKTIQVEAFPFGKIDIFFSSSLGGLENLNSKKRDKNLEKPLEEMPFKEKIRFAMKIAQSQSHPVS